MSDLSKANKSDNLDPDLVKAAGILLKPNDTQPKSTARGKSKTIVKKQSKPNKVGRPRLKGVQPTYTHGKKMYISLDIHSYNLKKKGTDSRDIRTIISTIEKYPKINFTLYIYEKDKDKIPKLIEKFPNPNISYGLHLDPNAKDAIGQINRFYDYIAPIQPASRTPTSIHVGGEFGPKILKALEARHIPFVRSATTPSKENKVQNTPAVKDKSPAIKNVIAASAEKRVIDKFKTGSTTKNVDSYYTHPHQAKDKKQKAKIYSRIF